MTTTSRLALATFVVGFLVEGATEAYQFFGQGYLSQGWIGAYYIGIATTAAGFYLMYRGRHEWTHLHRLRVHHSHRALFVAAILFAIGTGAVAVLSSAQGGAGGSGMPPELVWVVGGLVTLALANFFLSLWLTVSRLVGPAGRILAGAAFVWSVGVAVLTGLLVGNETFLLLGQFVTDPLRLINTVAPLTFTMAPLFVSYFLFAAAYADAYRTLLPRAPADGAAPRTGEARADP